MRRFLFCSILLVAALSAAASHSPNEADYYVAVDVPTQLPGPTGETDPALPWTLLRHQLGPPAYTTKIRPPLPLPLAATIDACHLLATRIDVDGDGVPDPRWLFSLATARELSPSSPAGTLFLPEDLILYGGGVYTHFFCGDQWGIPEGVSIDAAFIKGGVNASGVPVQTDDGSLILSFDTPTTLPFGPSTAIYQPADMIELRRSGPGCDDWTFQASHNPIFDASAVTPPISSSANVIGADEREGRFILSLDVPISVSNVASALGLPGELIVVGVSHVLSVYHRDSDWEVSTRAGALCFPPPPGRSSNLILTKLGPSGSSVQISWSPSCSIGAEDYGIHEGVLPATSGAWVYNHDDIDCHDDGSDFVEIITTAPGNHYYLVVPFNANDEGSYGLQTRSVPTRERPPSNPAPNCDPNQPASQELGCP